jgi:hypothetical protein
MRQVGSRRTVNIVQYERQLVRVRELRAAVAGAGDSLGTQSKGNVH